MKPFYISLTLCAASCAIMIYSAPILRFTSHPLGDQSHIMPQNIEHVIDLSTRDKSCGEKFEMLCASARRERRPWLLGMLIKQEKREYKSIEINNATTDYFDLVELLKKNGSIFFDTHAAITQDRIDRAIAYYLHEYHSSVSALTATLIFFPSDSRSLTLVSRLPQDIELLNIACTIAIICNNNEYASIMLEKLKDLDTQDNAQLMFIKNFWNAYFNKKY